MNKLNNQTVYLVGGMDRVPDGGVVWRDVLTPKLTKFGLKVLNPCKKHEVIDYGHETVEDRELRKKNKQSGEFELVQKEMKDIRSVDLAMVDLSNLIIFYLDLNVHACGSYEEIFWANRCKKPVLIMCEQGRVNVPDWLFGTIPYQHMFDSWDELLLYLYDIDSGYDTNYYNRWKFFRS